MFIFYGYFYILFIFYHIYHNVLVIFYIGRSKSGECVNYYTHYSPAKWGLLQQTNTSP